MIKKLFSCCTLIVILTTAIFLFGIWQAYQFWWRTPHAQIQPIEIVIEEGDRFGGVARNLEEKSVIRSEFWFRVYGRMTGSQTSIQPGVYAIRNGDNYRNILDKITAVSANEVQITIPEGYTLAQIGDVVTENFKITLEEWNAVIGVNSALNQHEFVVASQKPSGLDLEGYLFPDTYRFFAEATAEDIARKMIDTMQQHIEEESITPPDGWTMHELLTLASIVEREVRAADEMAMVADIFLKRIETGIPLQSDATVNYATGGNSTRPTYDELEVESPYNTYQNAGLPPGPISQPGLNSIRAVSSPIPNDYYYFLTSPDGTVYYGRTFEEHIANRVYLD